MDWTNIVLVIQLFFGVIIGLYFWNLLRGQRVQKVSIDKESRKEMEQLRKLRSISLTEPLAEKVRPKSFDDIVGQEDGIKALKAALCGPNPQHVIIYGPPGVGKTAAARLVLEEAKKIRSPRLRKMRCSWSLTRRRRALTSAASPTPSSARCTTRFTRGPGRWGKPAFPSRSKGR